jgi:glycosyltransferase involved in cell wall biosynthesis
VNHDELQNYYKKAKIYCQFSRSESFGVSVVEAMYFGCVPFVTNAGGLPEIVGKNGIIANRNPIDILSKNIIDTLNLFPDYKELKQRIKNSFMVSSRKKILLTLIKD